VSQTQSGQCTPSAFPAKGAWHFQPEFKIAEGAVWSYNRGHVLSSPKKKIPIKMLKEINKIRPIPVILILTVITSGCATSTIRTSDDFLEKQQYIKNVLVLEPNIEVKGFVKDSKGLVRLEKETQTAIENIVKAVKNNLTDKGYEVKYINEFEKGNQRRLIDKVITESTKITDVIKINEYPKPSGDFNYLLGFEINKIGEKTDADVLLFIIGTARIGRLLDKVGQAVIGSAIGIALAAFTGFGFVGYTHEDIASFSVAFIDSETSKVLWFNTATLMDTDLTRSKHAKRSIKQLFQKFPTALVSARRSAEQRPRIHKPVVQQSTKQGLAPEERLRRLEDLYKKGLLGEAKYNEEKKNILQSDR